AGDISGAAVKARVREHQRFVDGQPLTAKDRAGIGPTEADPPFLVCKVTKLEADLAIADERGHDRVHRLGSRSDRGHTAGGAVDHFKVRLLNVEADAVA